MEFYNKDKNNKYKPEKIIGQGTFGIIYKVLKVEAVEFYALKFITIANKNREKIKQEFDKELNVMKAMNKTKNKNIIELKDNFFDENNNGYCIVMELCDGNLKDILEKKENKSGLPLNIINKIFMQLNEALKTMISKEIIHRDLKPENILIKYTDKNNFDCKPLAIKVNRKVYITKKSTDNID